MLKQITNTTKLKIDSIKMDSDEENQTFWQGYFYTINSIIGSGILAIPWAYTEGGWLLGLICQAFTTSFALILAYHLIQIMSRMEVLSKMTKNGYTILPIKFSQLFSRTFPEDFIISKKGYKDEEALLEIEDQPRISHVRYDMTEMISVLLGKPGGILFGVCLTVSIYGTLVAYSSIFASSLASTVPILGLSTCSIYEDDTGFGDDCWRKYWFYLFVLLAAVSVLVVIGLKEQAGMQAFMSVMRFVVIFLMLGTSIAALSTDTNLTDDESNEGSLSLINPMGIGITLPIIFMSSSFHSMIPNTIQYVNSKSLNVPKIIQSAICTVTVLFTLLGIIVPLAVSDIEGMITLSWIDYTGGMSDQSWWSYILMYIIVLFPALDVLSVFPILAINLSDNLISLKYGKFAEGSITKESFLFYRFIVIIPPILTAIFFYNLGYILDFTGTITLLGTGVFIPLMTITSRKLVPQHGDFDYWFSNDKWSWFILVASFVLFAVTWTFLLLWVI